MIRICALLVGLWASPALAVTCKDVVFETLSYTTCTVDPATERLELFLNDAKGHPYGSFTALQQAYPAKTISFAMNAGMYHQDQSPVGYFVQGGTELHPLLTGPSAGNFGMLPNGVFCLKFGHAFVLETHVLQAMSSLCHDATQSGPMLVIDGALHPQFLPNSTSRYVRNGVGTPADGGQAVFAISNQPVTFYEFARFFRDGLGLPNALYFDGNVSQLYAPSLDRSGTGRPMGPIVAVIE